MKIKVASLLLTLCTVIIASEDYNPNVDIEGMKNGQLTYQGRRYIDIRLEKFQKGIFDTYIAFQTDPSSNQFQQIHQYKYKVIGFTNIVPQPFDLSKLESYGTLFNRSTSKQLEEEFWSIYQVRPSEENKDLGDIWFGILYEKEGRYAH